MNCSICGKRLGFFASLGSRTTCGNCSRDARDEMARARSQYQWVIRRTAHGELALPQVLVLDELRSSAALRPQEMDSLIREALPAYAATLLADGVLSAHDEEQFFNLLGHFGLDFVDFAGRFPEVYEDLMVGMVARGWLPEQTSTRVLTKRSEVVHFEVAANVMKEVVEREWQGGSSGFSIPLGKGFRYRVGSVRGKSVVVGSHLAAEDTGLLTISSARIVFTGQKRTIDIPFGRLTSVESFSDGMRIHASNRQRPVLFQLGLAQMAAAILNAAYQRADQARTEPLVDNSLSRVSEASSRPPRVLAKSRVKVSKNSPRDSAAHFSQSADLVAKYTTRIGEIEEKFSLELDDLSSMLPDMIELPEYCARGADLYTRYADELEALLPKYEEARNLYMAAYSAIAHETTAEGGSQELFEVFSDSLKSLEVSIAIQLDAQSQRLSFRRTVQDERMGTAMLRAESLLEQFLQVEIETMEHSRKMLLLLVPH